MNKFNGTNGKWEEESFIDGDWLMIHTDEADICKVNMFPDEMNEESLANARLIIAAPELLEALKLFVHLNGCEEEGISSGMPTSEQWKDCAKKAEEAISNALDKVLFR